MMSEWESGSSKFWFQRSKLLHEKCRSLIKILLRCEFLMSKSSSLLYSLATLWMWEMLCGAVKFCSLSIVFLSNHPARNNSNKLNCRLSIWDLKRFIILKHFYHLPPILWFSFSWHGRDIFEFLFLFIWFHRVGSDYVPILVLYLILLSSLDNWSSTYTSADAIIIESPLFKLCAGLCFVQVVSVIGLADIKFRWAPLTPPPPVDLS